MHASSIIICILAYLMAGSAIVTFCNKRGWFDDCSTTSMEVFKPSRLYLGFLTLIWPLIALISLPVFFISLLGAIPDIARKEAEKKDK